MKRPSKPKTEPTDDDPLAGDLSELISTLKFRKAHFKLAPKDTTVTIRVPKTLVDAAKKMAKKKGIKYHRLMRDAIADYVVRAA